MSLTIESKTMTITSASGGIYYAEVGIHKDPKAYVTLYLYYTKGTETTLTFQPFRKETNLINQYACEVYKNSSNILTDYVFILNATKDCIVPVSKSLKEDYVQIKITPSNGASATGALRIELADYN